MLPLHHSPKNYPATSIVYMDVRAIGWSGIVQIAAFAGASFYSFGPGLGKRGRRGIFGRKAGAVCRSIAVQLAVKAPGFEHGKSAVTILACAKTFATGASRMKARRSDGTHGV